MRYFIVAVLVSSSVFASEKDHWKDCWEARVNEADNPDAKARDMVNDWVFDHSAKLRSLDPATIATGQRIIGWMADHDIPLPGRARAAYDQIKTALMDRGLQDFEAREQTASLPSGKRSKSSPRITAPADDTLAGDILPRSSSEIQRQQVDDIRQHRIPEPERTVRAEVVNFGE